jgi:hypothetical protein
MIPHSRSITGVYLLGSQTAASNSCPEVIAPGIGAKRADALGGPAAHLN